MSDEGMDSQRSVQQLLPGCCNKRVRTDGQIREQNTHVRNEEITLVVLRVGLVAHDGQTAVVDEKGQARHAAQRHDASACPADKHDR